jgi:hypothetical protein
MTLGKPRRPLLLTLLVVGVIAAIVFGAAIPLYTGQKAATVTSSQSNSTQSQSLSSGSFVSLSNAIPLPSTQGRIDHMSVDLSRGLLFVAGFGNNTIGIVDIKSGHLVGSIGGLDNPQGVSYVPDAGRLFVSNAGDGALSVFDGESFAPLGRIALAGDADNMRYDSGTRLLYVGYGSGGMAAVNTTSNSVVMTSALPAHPESFQVEKDGRAAYVNVPTANLIVVVDKITGDPILNRSISGSNFPMAIDEAGERLFVGTRTPPELMVFDTSTPSLRSVANLTIAGDPDDIFYDQARGLVYVSCGEGFLEVVRQADSGHYSLAQTIATAPGARTSLFVPESGSIYVGVPPSTGQQAEILVYAFGQAGVSSTSSTSSTSPIAPTPTAALLSVTPGHGPSGLDVNLAGNGYVPGVTYQVCIGGYGNATCGFRYTSADYLTTIDEFAMLGSFVADSAGSIPAGTTVTVPDLFGGTYLIGVVPDGKGVFFVSAPFKVEPPTLSVGLVTVAAGASVTLTGGGYAPSTTYTVCFVPVGTVDCGYTGDREETPPGFHLGTFAADAAGSIPSGTVMVIPLRPPGQYAIGVFQVSGGYILISEVQFTVTAAG